MCRISSPKRLIYLNIREDALVAEQERYVEATDNVRRAHVKTPASTGFDHVPGPVVPRRGLGGMVVSLRPRTIALGIITTLILVYYFLPRQQVPETETHLHDFSPSLLSEKSSNYRESLDRLHPLDSTLVIS